ncbi:tetratricopeptide repeat protein [Geobacter argillaceus]|uniref:tetratricopeptide repeat protein n=1 Tax=Geobacter argillaceus TaxID=345631 RepID=UPI00119D9E27|nr:tetratricopeptide repeat protein [Geobacter argillaceus]
MSHFITHDPPPWEEPLRKAMHAHAGGDVAQAASLYRAILNEYPFLSRVAYNLGNILKESGEYDQAELLYRQAVSAEPELFEAAQNLALVIQEQGRIGEAIDLYRNILDRWPGLPDPRFSLACLQLLSGRLHEGWEGYEARFDCLVNPVPRRHPEIPSWDGTLARGVRLLVHTEQGFGDAIQMSRYLPLLIAADIHVILETDACLVPVLSRIPGLTACLARGEVIPRVDAQVPMMSLPRLFGTTLATIPAPSIPPPEETLIRQTAELLPPATGLRIGLCWCGRQDISINRKRSCPPELIRRLLDIPDHSFVTLQTNAPPAYQLTDPRLTDPTGQLGNFHDTAALMASLDMVITIDTAVAHLAGSLGKPTWLLLPFVPDWRWLLERDDSPWYPSMRLFRQPGPGAWEPVIDLIQLELARRSPCPGEALTNRGAILGMAGRHEEALEIYREALGFAPAIAVTHYNRGNSLAALGYVDEAREAWNRSLTLDPGLVEARHNLAVSLRDHGDLAGAHELVRQALQLRPEDADLHHTLGELLQAEERFGDAIDSFRNALELRPESARTWNSLGVVYQSLEEDRSAEKCYRRALEFDPGHLHARNNLGAVLLTLGRPQESVRELVALLELAPGYEDGHWNLACSLLAAGEWQRGWQEFESRFRKHSPVEEPHHEIPRWTGDAPEGRTILLTGEQAFGDTIQFVRFAPMLAARGARVVLECQAAPLVQLLVHVSGISAVICRGEPLPPVDCRLPLMSLPHMLGISAEKVAATVPYLQPDQKRFDRWRPLVAADAGLSIGLCWWGRQTRRNRRRSCPPELLAPLAGVPGVTLYRLQVGDDAPAPPFPLVDHTGLIHDFADTAALISCLDLVITIDTAVAHLAGGLGKPVWLMLPPTGDWRWMTGREDSPWYPTMRIYRQETPGDWSGLVARLVASLREELLTRQGHDLMAKGLETDALECFRTATGHRDATAASWLNLGNALHRTGATSEGQEALRRAVQLAPSYPEAWQNLGLLNQEMGEISDAFICFQQALRLRNGYPTARWNLSLLQLLLEDYDEGFRNYESRFDKIPPIPLRHAGLPLWDGTPLNGKRIIVHAEQGYGDTIQFCRYLPFLTAAGASVIFEVQDQCLLPLMRTLACHCTLIARGDAVPPADLQVPLMSLPRIFRTRPETVPAAIPYLRAAPGQVELWRNRMVPGENIRVGIAWKGRSEHVNDRFRSCPPEELGPLGHLTGIDWYSLQVDSRQGPLPPLRLVDLTARIADFGDTAALISNLDLVISVDTSVAHLAGALGIATRLLLPFAPDWRWGLHRNDTPWYPGMRLFRQRSPGDWQDLITQVADALTGLTRNI